MNKNRNNWISKHPERLPDFIIGGAMKSGTTTLHSILNRHPSVKMAQGELGFFDIDSILEHPDFNFFDKKSRRWTMQSMNENPEQLWNWYYSNFMQLKTDNIKTGEDSTTYLASSLAAKRIAAQQKPIKLIFILRHPTKRAISNYLHALKSGRATYNLEDTLRNDPNSILKRSMYKDQLEVYYKHIPFNRIKIVIFEEFISNPNKSICEICEFLDIDFKEFNEEDLKLHSNKTQLPKYEKMQLFRNRLLKYHSHHKYASHLPVKPHIYYKLPLIYRAVNRIHKKINPMQQNLKYQANPSTVAFLDAFFKTSMDGLDELVNKEITSKWFV